MESKYCIFYKFYDKFNNQLDLSIDDTSLVYAQAAKLELYIHDNTPDVNEVDDFILNEAAKSIETTKQTVIVEKNLDIDIEPKYLEFNRILINSYFNLENQLKVFFNKTYHENCSISFTISKDVKMIVSEELIGTMFKNYKNEVYINPNDNIIKLLHIDLSCDVLNIENCEINVDNIVTINSKDLYLKRIKFSKNYSNDNQNLKAQCLVETSKTVDITQISFEDNFRLKFVNKKEDKYQYEKSSLSINNIFVNFIEDDQDKVTESIIHIYGHYLAQVSNLQINRRLDKLTTVKFEDCSTGNLDIYINKYRNKSRSTSEIKFSKVSRIRISHVDLIVTNLLADSTSDLYSNPETYKKQDSQGLQSQDIEYKDSGNPIAISIAGLEDLSTCDIVNSNFDNIDIAKFIGSNLLDLFIYDVTVGTCFKFIDSNSTNVHNFNIGKVEIKKCYSMEFDNDKMSIYDLTLAKFKSTSDTFLIEAVKMTIEESEIISNNNMILSLLPESTDDKQNYIDLKDSYLESENLLIENFSKKGKMNIAKTNFKIAKSYSDKKFMKVNILNSEITANVMDFVSYQYILTKFKINNDRLNSLDANLKIRGFMKGDLYLKHNISNKNFNINMDVGEYTNNNVVNKLHCYLTLNAGDINPMVTLIKGSNGLYFETTDIVSDTNIKINLDNSLSFKDNYIYANKNERIILTIGSIPNSDLSVVNYVASEKDRDYNLFNYGLI